MKKIWILILWLFSLFFIWSFTQAKDYEYSNLDITANILEDWTIDIEEDFTANFFVNKHWIIRDIPLNYSVEWNDFHIEVSNINVEWKKFKTSKNNWNIEIKIGDANRTIIWEQNYPISYTTYGLIRNFSWMWYAELYWNLVGYDFNTNINQVRAELILPKIYTWFSAEDFLITTDWTTKTIDGFAWIVNRSKWDRIIITYDKWLPAYQWITLAIKFPNNYFEFDDNKQSQLIWSTNNNPSNKTANDIVWFMDTWFIVMCFLAVWVAIWAIVYAFKKFLERIKNSRALKWDFAKKFPVIIQYEPPKWLNSAEVWLLLHRRSEVKDLLSLIYKWAAEWIINISLEDKSFFDKLTNNDVITITKIKDIPEERPDYEKDFFKNFIHWKKTKITKTTNLYDRLLTHKSAIAKHGQDKWWFKNPKKDKTTFSSLFNGKSPFIKFFWLCIWLYVWAYIIFLLLGPLFSLFLFWFIIFISINSVSTMKETEEWARLISHILWYKEFLKTCDENKLRLFLQQDPLYFDKILPYAVVFWLDTELIKKIEPIMQEMNVSSSWYNQIDTMNKINRVISSSARHSIPPKASDSSTSYSSDSWFSGGSSFGGGFSSGGWWGGWGWRSW